MRVIVGSRHQKTTKIRRSKPMKTIVIYSSKTGFTKRYAGWIAEETGAECLPLAEAKKKDLAGYDAIVFGGWACAGSIKDVGWFTGNMDRWKGKKQIVFCVGASPVTPDVEKSLAQNFNEPKLEGANVFYCPGGLNYEKMSVSSRLMMRMFVKAIKAKKDKSATEEEMARVMSASYDISDKKYIEPIITCLRG